MRLAELVRSSAGAVISAVTTIVSIADYMPTRVNPSRWVVLQEDDGCYNDDRGVGAAADKLRKARRARGMKNSMPSLR